MAAPGWPGSCNTGMKVTQPGSCNQVLTVSCIVTQFSRWRLWNLALLWFVFEGIRLRACLQGERVILASRLKLAMVYKQISQVGLPYHQGQLYQLYWRVSSCVTFFVTSKIWNIIWSSLWNTREKNGKIFSSYTENTLYYSDVRTWKNATCLRDHFAQ